MSESKRIPGYYWASRNGYTHVACWWDGQMWYQPGIVPYLDDDAFISIDERPIVRAAVDTEEIMVDKELIEETCKVLLDFVHCSNETNADAWVCMKKLNDLIKP
jgi:hypothetical protein